jgi:shikimate kinase
LLRHGDPGAPLASLAEERRPAYSAAHVHVKSGDGAHRDVVDSILKALEDYLSSQA